jgi:hypothetical protein
MRNSVGNKDMKFWSSSADRHSLLEDTGIKGGQLQDYSEGPSTHGKLVKVFLDKKRRNCPSQILEKFAERTNSPVQSQVFYKFQHRLAR